MSKELIISFDDLFEGNDNWETFEKLYQEFPDIKITFFVITGPCSEEYLKKLKRPWNELVFHSWEHSGHWLDWDVEKAKEWMQKNRQYDFEPGFKAPAYKYRAPMIQAANELDYWICSGSTVPIVAKRYWHTHPRPGVFTYPDKMYDEYYDHIQCEEFFKNIEELRQYIIKEKPVFKFISEKIINHNYTQEDDKRNSTYYWK